MTTATPSAVANLHRMQFYRRQPEWKLDRPENSTSEESFKQKDQSSERRHSSVLPIQDCKQKIRKQSHWKVKDCNNNSEKEREYSSRAAEDVTVSLEPDLISGSYWQSRSLESLVGDVTFMLEANCRPHSSRCDVRTDAELTTTQHGKQTAQNSCFEMNVVKDIPPENKGGNDMPCEIEATQDLTCEQRYFEEHTPAENIATAMNCVEESWISLLETASPPACDTKTKPKGFDKNYLSKVLQCAEKIERGKQIEQRMIEGILFEEIMQMQTIEQFGPLFGPEQNWNTFMVDPKPNIGFDYEPETQMLDLIPTLQNAPKIHSINCDWDRYLNMTRPGDPLYSDLRHTSVWTPNNNTWFFPTQVDEITAPCQMMYTNQTHQNLYYNMGPANSSDRNVGRSDGTWGHSDAFHRMSI